MHNPPLPFTFTGILNPSASPSTDPSPLSLHDALPISQRLENPDANTYWCSTRLSCCACHSPRARQRAQRHHPRSEEHTSELQSPCNLVCRLLHEKKKTKNCSRMPHRGRRTTSTTTDRI